MNVLKMKKDEMISKLEEGLAKEKYSKIYIGLQQFFKYIQDLSKYDAWIENFFTMLNENFRRILEKDWQKNRMTRDILQKSLDKTMGNSQIDVKKDDFFKQKIYMLFAEKKDVIYEVFIDPQFPKSAALNELIVKLLKNYNFSSDNYVSVFYKAFFNEKDSCRDFIEILDTLFDLSPKLSLEYTFKWLKRRAEEQNLLDSASSKHLMIIMAIFSTYCEIYPDYFRIYLEDFIEIFISQKDRLINSTEILGHFSFVVHYFSKRGEYTGARFIPDFFNIAISAPKEPQRLLFLSVRELMENYPEEITRTILIGDAEKFYGQILQLMKRTTNRSIIDILLDIFFFIKLESKRLSFDDGKEDALLPKKLAIDLFNTIVSMVDKLISILEDLPYLLLKTVSEVDSIINILNEQNPGLHLDLFEERFLEEEILSQNHKETKIRSVLTSLCDQLKLEIESLRETIQESDALDAQ